MSAPSDQLRVDGKRLWNILADGQFHKAKDIFMESRRIRMICAQWPSRFISTQAGYKRVAFATDGEIEYASADLKSRCRKLVRRYMAHDKVLKERHQPPLKLV